MKIKELLPGALAVVEFGGVERRVSVRLLDGAAVGDSVLVHAGYAIEKLSPADAEANAAVFAELRKGPGQ